MNLLSAILNGFSQVFLQENLLFGIFVAIGLGITSPISLLFALVGLATSLITAHLIGAKEAVINSGLYSFNGILIGITASYFIKQIPIAVGSAVILSAMGTLLYFAISKNNILPFTTPFVLSGWIILLLLRFIK